jgi:hypothetical protein
MKRRGREKKRAMEIQKMKKGIKRKNPDLHGGFDIGFDIGIDPETKNYLLAKKQKTKDINPSAPETKKKKRIKKSKEQNVFTAGNLQPWYKSQTCVYTPMMLEKKLTNTLEKKDHPHHIYMGFDLSLTSPAITVMIPETRTLHAYFLWDRKKPLKKTELSWSNNNNNKSYQNWTWIFHPTMALFNDPDQEVKEAGITHSIYRYRRITERLKWIQEIVETYLHHQIKIGIEHYSFQSGQQGQNQKFASAAMTNLTLAELGGCVRHYLCQFPDQIQVLEIAPLGIKKSFIGAGKTKKNEMYQAYLLRHNGPSLDDVFPFTKSITEFEKDTPSPVSDFIDSLAACFLIAYYDCCAACNT